MWGFFFVCLFPRAQDYLTNITTSNTTVSIFLWKCQTDLVHFQDERLLFVLSKMIRIPPLFTLKIHLFLVCEAPQNQRYRFPSFPLVNSKAIWIFPLERLRLSDNGRSFRASTPLSYVLTHCMPPVLHPMESSSRLQNASYLFLA